MAKRIEFFFDFVSPYSYLAWTQLEGLTEEYDEEIAWRPLSLRQLLAGIENAAPPHELKRRYMRRDLERFAERYGVPLTLPAGKAPRADVALRIALASDGHAGQETFIASVFRTLWAHGEEVESLGVLRTLCDRAGLDGDRLIERATSSDIDALLAQRTRQALEQGVFGLPSFIVDGELFFGQDRLSFVREALER
ncbi:2-hydroxychromene-2-carboxylate isomerase [Halotalea alkalilenta]|uniref:2-hydroxychromene-2-carboxylate isomerase n=1 Tax=Halotalea alkalilenta TaxID=376489 RepID=UPI0004875CCA|nr:2-hydroxychromene-2-carboxylate isomerase [Halotalea alkalilenta]